MGGGGEGWEEVGVGGGKGKRNHMYVQKAMITHISMLPHRMHTNRSTNVRYCKCYDCSTVHDSLILGTSFGWSDSIKN